MDALDYSSRVPLIRQEIPHAENILEISGIGELSENASPTSFKENILEISGIGENTLSGILAEMGDISRFILAEEKTGVVNRPVMYPQSYVPGDASKSAVWEHPLDDARTRWARYKLLI